MGIARAYRNQEPGFEESRISTHHDTATLRIAQVAPLWTSVPPREYGGAELMVHWLTEELVRQGHDVTLFASGDSVTEANLFAVCERSLRLDEHCVDQLSHHVVMLEQVMQRAAEFDVIRVPSHSLVGPKTAWCTHGPELTILFSTGTTRQHGCAMSRRMNWLRGAGITGE